jgi:[ribosomal protein S5]-alanine N-acetyltransferase
MLAASGLLSERLRLEPLAPRHAAETLAYYDRNRAHLEPWEPDRSPEFYTLEHHVRDAERCAVATAHGECARFAAFERDGEEIVALINLWNIRRGVVQAAVIGYSVDARRAGRGYATEAVKAVVEYAFATLKLHRLETSYQPTNERSGRVLRRLGFTVEGYARDYLYLQGAWRDGILVGLTNPAWTPDAAEG